MMIMATSKGTKNSRMSVCRWPSLKGLSLIFERLTCCRQVQVTTHHFPDNQSARFSESCCSVWLKTAESLKTSLCRQPNCKVFWELLQHLAEDSGESQNVTLQTTKLQGILRVAQASSWRQQWVSKHHFADSQACCKVFWHLFKVAASNRLFIFFVCVWMSPLSQAKFSLYNPQTEYELTIVIMHVQAQYPKKKKKDEEEEEGLGQSAWQDK